MASRRMRIKTLAKVPSAARPRPSDRPTTPVHFDESRDGEIQSITSPGIILQPPSPSTPRIYHTSLTSPGSASNYPLASSPNPVVSSGIILKPPSSPKPASFFYDIASPPSSVSYPPVSPKPPILYNIASPMSPIVAPSSPKPPVVYHVSPFPPGSPKIHQSDESVPIHVKSISSAGLLSPRTPQSISMPPSPASSYHHPDSPRRPTTPHKEFQEPTTPKSQQICSSPHPSHPSTSAAGSTDTLRQRLQKSSIAPSTSKYAMIRKDYLAKYQNKTQNPKELTILHYAFFNPPGKSDDTDEPSIDNEDEVFNDELTSEDEGKSSRKRKRPSAAVESDVENRPTSPPPPPTPTNTESESTANESSEAEAKKKKSSAGPRVKVGPDGQLIVDEQSLITETSESQRAKERLAQMETVSGANFVVGSSGMYRKKAFKRGTDWSSKETIRFYRALMSCGTDFSMMASLFKNRTRSELKAKFKREDRRNQAQVSRALQSQVFDPTLPLTDSDDDEKEQEVVAEEETVAVGKGGKRKGTRTRRKALPEVDNLISDSPEKAPSPSKQLRICDKELPKNKEEKVPKPRRPRRKSAAVAPSVDKFLPKHPKSRRIDRELVTLCLGLSEEEPKTIAEKRADSPKKTESPKKDQKRAVPLKRTAIPHRVPGPGAGFKGKVAEKKASGDVEIEIEIEMS